MLGKKRWCRTLVCRTLLAAQTSGQSGQLGCADPGAKSGICQRGCGARDALEGLPLLTRACGPEGRTQVFQLLMTDSELCCLAMNLMLFLRTEDPSVALIHSSTVLSRGSMGQ